MPLKTFLTNKNNAQQFRLNGLVPSLRLPNKRQLCQSFRDHILYRAEQLPPKVDLRSDMTPVEDQSKIGSCAANCLAGAYEYLTKKANGRNTDVSRLFVYYNARVKDQKSERVEDTGCTMTSAIEALEESGICLESIWPYDISRVNTRPNDQAYQEATRHKITEALRININLHEMKSCLAQGFPFAFGLKLYASFDQAATTGVVPMPNTGDNGRQSDGSHALLAVGYSDQSNAFIVRNSWGEQWGDKGYCYIPYQYVTDSNLCFDVWTIRKLATDSFGREHWDINDRTNYSRVRNNNHFDDNSRIIEASDDDGDDSQRGNQWDDSWNQYRTYGGYGNSKYCPDRYREPFQGNPVGNSSYSLYDQFREQDNNFDFRGGYSGFDQFVNNSQNYFNQQFNPSPLFYRHQPYGVNYGYTNPFNPYF